MSSIPISRGSLVPEAIRERYVVRNVAAGISRLWKRRITRYPLLFLTSMVVIAIIGPELTPYPFDETLYVNGQIPIAESPSLAHPLGTTNSGHDVLSRVIVGARPTMITGFLGGGLIIGIGMTIGVTAGYVGGWVENALMRFTDVAYSVPLIPFALVLLALFGISFVGSIIAIGVILWRGNARVLRSQVIQIKERPFVRVAKATGASRRHIIVKHILPNVAPMAFLFFALGIGYAIIVQASLAFLGASDPNVPSWGIMIRNAYSSGHTTQLGWSLVPGLLISFTVMSAFLIGREFEVDDTNEPFAEG